MLFKTAEAARAFVQDHNIARLELWANYDIYGLAGYTDVFYPMFSKFKAIFTLQK